MKTQVVRRDEAVAELATWDYKGHLYTEAAVLLKVGTEGVMVGILSYTDLETVLVPDSYAPFYKNYCQAMSAFGALLDEAIKE